MTGMEEDFAKVFAEAFAKGYAEGYAKGMEVGRATIVEAKKKTGISDNKIREVLSYAEF